MEQAVLESAVGQGLGHSQMTLTSLLLGADWVVKTVLLILVVASVWCWAIIFDKTLRFRQLQIRANKFEDEFWSGVSLEELYDRIGKEPGDPMTAVFAAAMREWRRSSAKGLVYSDTGRSGLRDRLERVMQLTVAREIERLERYMMFLASVGSTAPFIGLFGTVWGVMNSFMAIAATKQTNLAVVAPGIAEALFATALGLVAAIPAVVAYNKLSNDLGRYAGRMETFAGEFIAILSRQIEETE
ncbi:MAG: protein TolQ [Rhodospirillaceae bacterium]|nr:protein TolQ [Rhodospirillaceae bacterium]|tara:strand:+ start:123 stop:851 length:729 start_codon:yes stop_codon:yes gene_type:complete